MTNKVALIGAGVMGSAIGTRLLETGNQLSVYDLDRDRIAALVAKGANAAPTAAAAAQASDFVILSLNSPKIVRSAVFGTEGVAAGARAGTLIIDMSSIDPESTKILAGDAAERALGWLDCPLSGGAPKAIAGELTVMAGGNSDDFERSKTVMEHLCANFTLMGPSGAGQTTKLINQVLCALNFVAVAEATQLALDAGVDAVRIPGAIAGGRADSAILQEYMAKMALKDYTPSGSISNMVKDLNGVQDLARLTGTPMPLTAVCAEIHRLLVSAGHGSADNAALMKYFEGPGA
uniref:NAD(P)-dependent oxidoreductase n=1 Tax=Pararhizobium sp. IMCC3301 TaxID=3067904 RepID=UPI0027403262|nr:NAD(P)-dependent oxidoreductase [Pararhizobium sp. IMCC3301]